MADYAICYTDAEHTGILIVIFVLLGLAPFGVCAIWSYLKSKAIEFIYPVDNVMIDEHLRTFKVVLRHDQQKEKLRREMHRIAREHRQRR